MATTPNPSSDCDRDIRSPHSLLPTVDPRNPTLPPRPLFPSAAQHTASQIPILRTFLGPPGVVLCGPCCCDRRSGDAQFRALRDGRGGGAQEHGMVGRGRARVEEEAAPRRSTRREPRTSPWRTPSVPCMGASLHSAPAQILNSKRNNSLESNS